MAGLRSDELPPAVDFGLRPTFGIRFTKRNVDADHSRSRASNEDLRFSIALKRESRPCCRKVSLGDFGRCCLPERTFVLPQGEPCVQLLEDCNWIYQAHCTEGAGSFEVRPTENADCALACEMNSGDQFSAQLHKRRSQTLELESTGNVVADRRRLEFPFFPKRKDSSNVVLNRREASGVERDVIVGLATRSLWIATKRVVEATSSQTPARTVAADEIMTVHNRGLVEVRLDASASTNKLVAELWS